MTIFFSKSTGGFYDSTLRASYAIAGTWPTDAVELTQEEQQTYHMQQPPEGKMLGSMGGRPAWVDIPPPPPPTREQVESARRRAYADPLTGSDPIFSEAYRMQLMGETGWESVRDAAIARYQEIQAEHPWPTE